MKESRKLVKEGRAQNLKASAFVGSVETLVQKQNVYIMGRSRGVAG